MNLMKTKAHVKLEMDQSVEDLTVAACLSFSEQ